MSELFNDHFEPIFVVGHPRSGTTLLASLLDRHSRIAISPETEFLMRSLPCGRPSKKLYSHNELIESLFNNYRFRDLRLDQKDVHNHFIKCDPLHKELFKLILKLYSLKNHKVRCGEKSPVHLLYVPTILKWFPQSKIICIIRDGRDVVHSIMNVPWGHKNLLRHCAEWAFRSKLAFRFNRDYPNSFISVKYEILIHSPVDTLKHICNFIGETYENNQLISANDIHLVPNWESPWKSNALNTIDSSRVGLWKNAFDINTLYNMTTIMESELSRWGYSLNKGKYTSLFSRILSYFCTLPYTSNVYKLIRIIRDSAKFSLCKVGLRKTIKL